MEEQELNGVKRRKDGTFLPGSVPNPSGRPEETEEKKVARKAMKELIIDYKEKLAEVLPELSPILMKLALEGDMPAIKELHDRVMGKPEQKVQGDPDNPLQVVLVKFMDGKQP